MTKRRLIVALGLPSSLIVAGAYGPISDPSENRLAAIAGGVLFVSAFWIFTFAWHLARTRFGRWTSLLASSVPVGLVLGLATKILPLCTDLSGSRACSVSESSVWVLAGTVTPILIAAPILILITFSAVLKGAWKVADRTLRQAGVQLKPESSDRDSVKSSAKEHRP